ncbi:uncharacterized protein LOC143035288 isoform X2 [Oratosquilla oratoria]|uniref:uncharacterized protein LOC143035288 isoform X2 n=1 Tax=Oratosquilla oratoria TaxID=337810 RepID=UPI003F772222
MTGKRETELYKLTMTPDPLSVVGHDMKLEFVGYDKGGEATISYTEDMDPARPNVVRSERTVKKDKETSMANSASWIPKYHLSVMEDNDRSSEIMYDSKKPRKSVNLQVKLEIIRRHEAGQGANSIARAVGLAQSTVSTIIKNSCTIKTAKSFMIPASNRIPKSRDIVMAKMERILRVWIENHIRCQTPLSTGVITSKAKTLWETVRRDMAPEALKGTADTFKASSGWFERFKRRSNLCNLTFNGKVTTKTAAKSIAVKYGLDDLQDIIAKGGYSPRQVLNIDKTELCWKNLQAHTEISQEGSIPSVRIDDDPLTLILGSNAEGDFKLKPLLVYQWENPLEISRVDKENLPVMWQSSPGAKITTPLFRNYIVNYLTKACKEYSKATNIPNKFLLLIDDSSTYPVDMGKWTSNIEVMFLPSNTKPPMSQDVLSTFTAYYFHHTMEQLIFETDGDTKPTVEEFWKSFTIKKAIDNIVASWTEIKQSTLNEAWKAIWPACVYEFFGFNDDECIKRYSLDLSHESGFSEADDDEEYFDSDSELSDEMPLTFGNKKLDEEQKENLSAPLKSSLVMHHQMKSDSKSTSKEERQEPSAPLKSLSTTQLRLFLTAISDALAIVVCSDEDTARSSEVSSKVNEAIECYQELYKKKLEKIEQSVTCSSFHPVNSVSQSSESGPPPPNSSMFHYGSQQKFPVCSKEDIEDTSYRNGRPIRKRKGTFITGPDFINGDEDGDIASVRKNPTAVLTESSKKPRLIKKSPGKVNSCIQTEEQIHKSPENRVNSCITNPHDISCQFNRPMVCIDKAEVSSYINNRKLERPMVFIDRAEVNIHSKKRDTHPVVFVDKAEVNTYNNGHLFDRPMVCVDRAEVRKWCSTIDVEKSSGVDKKRQEQKGKECDKPDVVKEEWELLELDRVKQEPDIFATEGLENISICDVQIKEEPDENMTLVKEEYEMDNTNSVQLNQI